MALISLQNISMAFGGPKVLDDLSFQIEKNQRICLLGRNGTGKSSLLKIISGELTQDSGAIHKDPGIKIAAFAQNIPQSLDGPVFNIIARGLGDKGELIIQHVLYEVKHSQTADHEEIARLHERMDALNAWAALDQINVIASRMDLDTDLEFQHLSGGMKRRVLLAAALVSGPDLLLLDEPTNHLDINAIDWLEEYLLKANCTILFVTHDRMLLRRLATRIIELDRGELVDWSCDYDTFLERKQAVLDNQEKEWERFDKKMAEEEIWIRKGIKARRTRNEGRVRALLKMREDRSLRREREGSVTMQITSSQRSGNMVIEAKDVSFGWNDVPIIKNLNTVISRGDKIGILGPNGCGKTTLVNLLLGNLEPNSGALRHGVNLTISYFDQLREQLDEDKSVWENVHPFGDLITVNGKTRHIVSYLQDFLFTPDRAKSPVKYLSGGERNRLLLAKLFIRATNLIVLDEPTNDLDVETLELLEELLAEFNGTVLVISHDRAFLNNVVTNTLVFTGNGNIKEYAGGYDDWLQQSRQQVQTVIEADKSDKKKAYKEEKSTRQKKKLSFKETREYEGLHDLIESLENEQKEIYAKMGDLEFFKNKDALINAQTRLKEIEALINTAYERWEYFEAFNAEN